MKQMNWKHCFIIVTVLCIYLFTPVTTSGETTKALVLQEMTWPDVKNYLKTSDMVIIPMGATEQHGPHLPLGTDTYEAFGLAKKISEKTGVVVAQVLWVGYSTYHSGFPGTLSLKPETMEQVLFETTEMLMKYGFRRFMFLNFHGGNEIVQHRLLHRINHTTKATAIAIGIGNSILPKLEEGDGIDWHAGKGETSFMLYLRPDLVHLDRAEKPVMTFSPTVKKLQELAKQHPGMNHVASKRFATPVETGKGGAIHEISNNGILSTHDPRTTATKEIGKVFVESMTDAAAAFINTWKKQK
ncbi:MAG: creatininase family protein [bacterium]|nr:creatininase family protein [bacterium]